jgi:ribosome biogenesis GTPase
MSIPEQLEKIGFEPWFLDPLGAAERAGLDIARVVAVHKERYTLHNGELDVSAELVGKLLYGAESAMDYPTVGDWVLAKFHNHQTFATIHGLLRRKSLLKRKTPGKTVDFQLIAANIDVALIIQSIDENFNLRRLERYLVMVNQSHIKPIILLSKIDLIKPEAVAVKIAKIHQIMPELAVYAFSNRAASGLEHIPVLLTPGKTYCLLGSSGVGKTTLLNNLVGGTVFKTGQVRQKDSKGRHVTTQRQLIMLQSGAMVVDTPGMRELGQIAVDTGLDETFDEISQLAPGCRYGDCRHIREKGCAVLDAVKKGRLSRERYDNYIKMTRESAYNDMSYHEKRVKDKQFGKMVKSVMQQKKMRR